VKAESELENLCSGKSTKDPSLDSLRELYEQDLAEPELGIINVTGLKCAGVPIGTPELVNAFVRSKAHAIEMFKSFASSMTQKSIMICCAFVNRRALHFSPATCLLVLMQDSIVQAILHRGLGANFDTLSAHELA
jgi:hypothetical protein